VKKQGKRSDEEFGKSKFDEFLKSLSLDNNLTWEKGDEPPDYYLYINGNKYAVEITTLMEKVSIGDNIPPIPTKGIEGSLRSFVKNVEETAKKNGYLNGVYTVSFLRHIHGFKEIKEELKNSLLEYIKNTKNLENHPEKEVFRQRIGGICDISKNHNKSNRVDSNGIRLGWGEVDSYKLPKESDVSYQLLKERIDNKMGKLKKINEPKILILLDNYHFAESEVYRNNILHISSIDFFHTIFLVMNGNGLVLHSKNQNWLH